MKIVADDKIPFLKGVLEPYAEVHYLPGKAITREVLLDTDALLIRTRTKCTEALLNGSAVKFIGTATIGFDHIDTHYCEKNKIVWTNAPGCNSSSVRQYIASGLLKIASENGFSLKGKSIGIVGVGNVGSKVEKFARTMGMTVLLNDPPRARAEGKDKFVNMNTLLSESDIVTVHVPLIMTGEDFTYHLFTEKILKKMKKGTWFINSSRGEVADTNSLIKFLDSGKPGGAVLDVWEKEPDIDRELLARVRLATPHIAGYSTDGKANGTSMVVNALADFFGLPVKDWYPANVPPPEDPVISIDCKGKNDEEIISDAVSVTYDIGLDDRNLRLSPSGFEKQRGEYRLRREFTAYTVDLKSGNKKSEKMLEALGFRILSKHK